MLPSVTFVTTETKDIISVVMFVSTVLTSVTVEVSIYRVSSMINIAASQPQSIASRRRRELEIGETEYTDVLKVKCSDRTHLVMPLADVTMITTTVNILVTKHTMLAKINVFTGVTCVRE